MCTGVVVEFVRSNITVSEGEGEAHICLRLEGQTEDQVIIKLTASPDTAEGRALLPKCIKA